MDYVGVWEALRQLQRVVDAEDVVALQVPVHQNFEEILHEPPQQAVYPYEQGQSLGIPVGQTHHVLIVNLNNSYNQIASTNSRKTKNKIE